MERENHLFREYDDCHTGKKNSYYSYNFLKFKPGLLKLSSSLQFSRFSYTKQSATSSYHIRDTLSGLTPRTTPMHCECEQTLRYESSPTMCYRSLTHSLCQENYETNILTRRYLKLRTLYNQGFTVLYACYSIPSMSPNYPLLIW